MNRLLPCILTQFFLATASQAEQEINLNAEDLSIKVGGFIRADVGGGDRYGDANDDDRIGISKAAFAVLPTYQNIKGVFVIGTEITSDSRSDEDGNVDIKDAFVTVSFGPVDFSVGALPLLFGLKGAGYPGDHTIQSSVEFGAGGVFAVSNQAGTSAVVDWNFAENMSLRLGVFDQRDYQDSGSKAATDPTIDNGSGIADNAFALLRGEHLFDTGLYFSAGFERRYVGDTVDDSKNIWAAGAGWNSKMFELSGEYQALDEAFNGTSDDDSYVIAEAAFKPGAKYRIYADYSDADEADVTTYRGGGNYFYNKHAMFTLEYARDDLPNDDVNSVDARITLTF